VEQGGIRRLTQRGSRGVANYPAARGGFIAFAKNPARELLPMNVQVNVTCP
jgi:hypothetical protein